MARKDLDARALDMAVPGGVALGGLLGLAVTDWLWPTAQGLRDFGWAPGLILLVCIPVVGGALYAMLARRGR